MSKYLVCVTESELEMLKKFRGTKIPIEEVI